MTQRLKTQVYFSSDRFAPDSVFDEDGGHWNEELANFLADGMRAKGFQITDPSDSDHGHVMEIANETFPVYLGCGPVGDERSFTAFVTPSEPFKRVWFRKYPTEPVLKPILAALDAVLADPTISDVTWEFP